MSSTILPSGIVAECFFSAYSMVSALFPYSSISSFIVISIHISASFSVLFVSRGVSSGVTFLFSSAMTASVKLFSSMMILAT